MLAGLALVTTFLGPPAPVEPPPTPTVTLTWTAPAGCPDHATVLARIEELVGRPLGQNPDQHLEVEGRIEPIDDRYRLDLWIREEGEIHRMFVTKYCEDFLIPASVSVAVAIDPERSNPHPVPPEPEPEPEPDVPRAPEEPEPAPPEPAPEPPPTTEPEPPPVPPSSTPEPRPERARPRARTALGLGGGLAGGILPAVGGSLMGGVGVLWPRLRLDLEGLWLTRRRVALDDGESGGTLRLGAARPLACGRFGGPAWHVPVCGGLELGVLTGRGYGVTVPRTQRHLWLAGLATAGAAWSATDRLTVRLRAELVVSPLRREFTLVDQSLFVTRSAGGRLHAGIEIHFP